MYVSNRLVRSGVGPATLCLQGASLFFHYSAAVFIQYNTVSEYDQCLQMTTYLANNWYF